MKIRDRIKELRRVPAADLRPNPKNWRTHQIPQKNALRGLLSEIGMADACIARELPDGTLMLIDGHLRAETVGTAVVPVLVLDVSEAEADKLLATLDPLAAMAGSDAQKLDELLQSIDTGNADLQRLITATANAAGLYKDNANEELRPASTYDTNNANELTPSGVRMVQLFLDESNIVDFQNACTALAEAYGTKNITDTVLEAVTRESASL